MGLPLGPQTRTRRGTAGQRRVLCTGAEGEDTPAVLRSGRTGKLPLLKSDDAWHLSLSFGWNWACGWPFLKCSPDDSEVYPGLKSMGLEGPGRPGEEGAVLVGRIEKCVPGKKKHVRKRQERGKSRACRGSS